MEEIFVTKLRINKVRHLENLEIPLSETERKHLILTGKNGSGKTSVLEGINVFLNKILYPSVETQENYIIEKKIKEYLSFKERYKALIESTNEGLNDHQSYRKLLEIDKLKIQLDKNLLFLKQNAPVQFFLNTKFDFNDLEFQDIYWLNGKFIIKYFPTKRTFEPKESLGPQKMELKKQYTIEENLAENFVRQLVNLRMDLLDAKDIGKVSEVFKVQNWFERFEYILKKIYNDDNLILEFDRPNFNYLIKIKDREPFNLNQLSDGYGAILAIISELTMRMDSRYFEFKFSVDKPYDLQGIVLIDEIEAHLHIDLQKNILPFLTSFFPKIQFIVTTHSPFVLNSIDNAVIYDLEKQERVENLSAYSYTNIVKGYFDADEYSDEIRKKVLDYEGLINKMQGTTATLSIEEKGQFYELKKYFEELPKSLSPELQLKIQQLELAQLAQ